MFYSAVIFKDVILFYGELKGSTAVKITPLQCDINKKKYNFIDIVNKNINNYCSCGLVCRFELTESIETRLT